MSLSQFEIVKLVNGSFSCEILANYGAALNAYRHEKMNFIDGYKHSEEIVNQQYKGVLLAPFPNRVAEAKYHFQDQEFSLAINRPKEALALHGLLYNGAFKVLESGANTCSLQYSYQGLAQGYPFPFDLFISYQLEGNGILTISTTTKNIGTDTMPFGLGWHPYFSMNQRIDELQLSFPESKQLLLDDRKIPTGERVTFLSDTALLDLVNHDFDDCFLMLGKGMNYFELIGKKYSLLVSAAADFPYFQLYTPKDRSSIAIEPMTCAPNAFNNEMGLILIPSGAYHKASFQIQAKLLE